METNSMERPKYKVSKSSVCLLIIFCGLIIYCLFSGISELCAEPHDISVSYRLENGRTVICDVDYGTYFPILTVTNSIDFIPMLNEYYYIVGGEDKMVIVRAGKNFGENFDSETFECKNGLKVNGKVRKLDSDARYEINKRLGGTLSADEDTYEYIDTYCYIDTYSRRIASIKVIIGAVSVIIAAVMIRLVKNKKENDYDDLSQKTLGKGFVMVIAIGAILLSVLVIYICMML